MKQRHSLLFLLTALVCVTMSACTNAPQYAQPTKVRALFLANSYTGVADHVRLLADSADVQVIVQVIAPGGWFLFDHWEHPPSKDAAGSGQWDVVVLQEQSLHAVLSPSNFLQNAALFARHIRAADTTPVYFETWARAPEHGIYGVGSVGSTPAEMQRRMRVAYLEAAWTCWSQHPYTAVPTPATGPPCRYAPAGSA